MAGRLGRKWIRRDESQWRALLSRFSGSGLTVAAFCEREGVSTASFHRWRERIRGGIRDDGGEVIVSPSAPAFLDLGCLDATASRAAPIDLRLDLGGGLTLHLVRR
jgi:hypothetical protein